MKKREYIADTIKLREARKKALKELNRELEMCKLSESKKRQVLKARIKALKNNKSFVDEKHSSYYMPEESNITAFF